jgi:dienelactone hydrolase
MSNSLQDRLKQSAFADEKPTRKARQYKKKVHVHYTPRNVAWSAMRLIAVLLGIAALPGPCIACSADAAGDTGVAQPGTRVEFASAKTAFRSLTTRMAPVEPITLEGRLRLPDGPTGEPLPAMLLVHGSRGPQWHHKARYEQRFNDAGIATFTIDSFAPRGIDSTVGRQHRLSLFNQTFDALSALQWLRNQPRIDAQRIGIIGWSRGGTVAIDAWRQRSVAEYRRHAGVGDDFGFAAHIAFYPSCSGREARIEMSGVPMLMLIGKEDDWTGVRACREWANAVRAAGHALEAVIYDDAAHAFDYPGSFHESLPHGESLRECAWIRRPDGFVDLETGRYQRWGTGYRNWYEWRARCAKTGVTVASNATARHKAFDQAVAFAVKALR